MQLITVTSSYLIEPFEFEFCTLLFTTLLVQTTNKKIAKLKALEVILTSVDWHDQLLEVFTFTSEITAGNVNRFSVKLLAFRYNIFNVLKRTDYRLTPCSLFNINFVCIFEPSNLNFHFCTGKGEGEGVRY